MAPEVPRSKSLLRSPTFILCNTYCRKWGIPYICPCFSDGPEYQPVHRFLPSSSTETMCLYLRSWSYHAKLYLYLLNASKKVFPDKYLSASHFELSEMMTIYFTNCISVRDYDKSRAAHAHFLWFFAIGCGVYTINEVVFEKVAKYAINSSNWYLFKRASIFHYSHIKTNFCS